MGNVKALDRDDQIEDIEPRHLLGRDVGKRELQSTVVTLFGKQIRIYWYEPASLEERAAARRCLTLDERGELHAHIDKWVDIIMLRVRNKSGERIFFNRPHKPQLLECPADEIESIVTALGADSDDQDLEALTKAAEGK